jgi:pimeloyl-ACP methyl ester carboxylesterase
MDESFAGLGVRVVTVDRPGYGGSSPQPGRRLENWPSDVAAVADELGVERFGVTGLSTGGAYVVASAALLPDRVVGAGVISGVSDFSWPGAWDGFLDTEAALMRMGDESQISAWCEAHYGADGMGFLEGGLGDLAPADHAVFEDEAFAGALVGAISEAFRPGVGGYAQDLVVQGRDWSFDPGAITAPVLILHGEADTLVPLAHPHHTAEMIKTSIMSGHLASEPSACQHRRRPVRRISPDSGLHGSVTAVRLDLQEGAQRSADRGGLPPDQDLLVVNGRSEGDHGDARGADQRWV